jgi:hypothetical protein
MNRAFTALAALAFIALAPAAQAYTLKSPAPQTINIPGGQIAITQASGLVAGQTIVTASLQLKLMYANAIGFPPTAKGVATASVDGTVRGLAPPPVAKPMAVIMPLSPPVRTYDFQPKGLEASCRATVGFSTGDDGALTPEAISMLCANWPKMQPQN